MYTINRSLTKSSGKDIPEPDILCSAAGSKYFAKLAVVEQKAYNWFPHQVQGDLFVVGLTPAKLETGRFQAQEYVYLKDHERNSILQTILH